MSVSCGPALVGLRIGATTQVLDRLRNGNDLDTLVTNASLEWSMIDGDGNPQTGSMLWDATYSYKVGTLVRFLKA